MSRSYPGEQVEHAFNSKRLKNWEVPAVDKSQAISTSTGTRFGTLQPRSGRTQFIVDDNGHLKSGVPKLEKSAFNFTQTTPVFMDSAPRWPKENPTWPKNMKATMGYKGIQSNYLPTNTVTLKAVEVPGTTERNFNFM
ncbi:hypothetical protein CHLRE_12g536100v5 [Chlamydomonas reinhardtii]|uniref:Protein Flattop homolog n=2 Tax=Chlamydomonas reinhardtii TaxID=3055 RepID=FLTOP_CHLRE|nr:uncharacterized protein CHLRE_12g536100v5 [Chlamydomonas reinhardtii]A8IVJ1.1 RecName: Full=Protein Flattop homolog; AltName: Full=Cilia- and flagella-associated protein 126; AltName: Full=Flagellum-associated protein 126 [Chlamydomonas reinhardtii]6U42_5H Chain 5H, FAP126 [Chlamydomonas reinhardtii]6U42_5I Chain 5I, FAP126 [Chlamydomonas reinhardtii]6U42_5J Chain 5J, FAP126 [Chlamydomonas reinhardtii]6U42_5K Chain 5K, FAP126 [Chlamydomonas reinhardtii]6VE7_H Chain H, Protein Flattop homol|eukprot:XP_001692883.1 flagellar associated protein [Chlamydomonas reinhardtii]